jgi:hypothetical protein
MLGKALIGALRSPRRRSEGLVPARCLADPIADQEHRADESVTRHDRRSLGKDVEISIVETDQHRA